MAENKESLLELITSKLQSFSIDSSSSSSSSSSSPPSSLLRDLQLLHATISEMPPSSVDKGYVEKIIAMHPQLTATSFDKAVGWQPPIKAQRRRDVLVIECDLCKGIVADGSCTKCGLTVRQLAPTGGKAKARDALTEKIATFPLQFDILTAEAPLDPRLYLYIEPIKSALIKKGYNVTRNDVIVPSDEMRTVFNEVDTAINGRGKGVLRTMYLHCNQMRYQVTGYRPKLFTAEEKTKILDYYIKVLAGFYKLIQSNADGEKQASNTWNIQAYIKLIIGSSEKLMKSHVDFYRSLHSQNTSTEGTHGEIWNKMMADNGWKFD